MLGRGPASPPALGSFLGLFRVFLCQQTTVRCYTLKSVLTPSICSDFYRSILDVR